MVRCVRLHTPFNSIYAILLNNARLLVSLFGQDIRNHAD